MAKTDWFVVVNAAECYSLWPAALSVPDGWRIAGPTGPKEDCLEWIAENWTDPRPAGVGREVA